jgi:hypothetical protein
MVRALSLAGALANRCSRIVIRRWAVSGERRRVNLEGADARNWRKGLAVARPHPRSHSGPSATSTPAFAFASHTVAKWPEFPAVAVAADQANSARSVPARDGLGCPPCHLDRPDRLCARPRLGPEITRARVGGSDHCAAGDSLERDARARATGEALSSRRRAGAGSLWRRGGSSRFSAAAPRALFAARYRGPPPARARSLAV